MVVAAVKVRFFIAAPGVIFVIAEDGILFFVAGAGVLFVVAGAEVRLVCVVTAVAISKTRKTITTKDEVFIFEDFASSVMRGGEELLILVRFFRPLRVPFLYPFFKLKIFNFYSFIFCPSLAPRSRLA